MDESNHTSLWNKKQDELTVGETFQVAAAQVVLVMAAPVAILGVWAGAATLYTKFKNRRADKTTETP